MPVKLSDVNIEKWDEDKIYQFMIDHFPELCPRNNETGKDFQMGIKAIRRGKKMIEALSLQSEVCIGFSRERLIKTILNSYAKSNPVMAEVIADAIISSESTLLEVKK